MRAIGRSKSRWLNGRIADALVDQSRRIGTFSHGFTYGGHPVAAAVALEALTIYEERDIVGHVRRVAPAFLQGMKRFEDHPLIGEARGVGLAGALEFVRDKTTKENFAPSAGVAAHAGRMATKHGVITRGLGDIISLCPAMIITEEQVEEMLSAIGRALDDTLVWARAEGLVA